MSGEEDRGAATPKKYLSFHESGELIDAEKAYIRSRWPEGDRNNNDFLCGLAISGGGIRSASFSIGVMQALARAGWMKAMDYLSTVSGGGYSGSSLTWFLHHAPAKKVDKEEVGEKAEEQADGAVSDGQAAELEEVRSRGFGVDADNFPFGTGVAHDDENETRSRKRRQIGIMRHLLQNINYLFPGRGINELSFAAVLGRGILLNLLTYLPLGQALVILLAVAAHLLIGVPPLVSSLYAFNDWALYALYVLGAAAVLYGVFDRLFLSWIELITGRAKSQEDFMYRLRQAFARLGGFLLAVAFGLLIISSLPLASWKLAEWRELFASGLAASGLLGSILSAFSVSGKGKLRIPIGILVPVASALLLYGLLLLLYVGAEKLLATNGAMHEGWISGFKYGVGLLAASLIFGWLVNINYITLHRYYRDRLMELFMPSLGDNTKLGPDYKGPPTKANTTYIHEVCDYANGVDGPYHIINGNVVLVGSDVTKFRGRGGDNFIFSPLYCGSSATGWASSREFLGGRLTLPTAMAISGAAVNPNTGSGGQGPTRNALLSILMSLLNLRQGFWAPNPQNALCGKRLEGKRVLPPGHSSWRMRMLWWIQCCFRGLRPNLIIPGMRDLLNRRFRESSSIVELTDGGHFENLALYELIRRRLDCIVLVDGAADPGFGFADFAHLVEIARMDFAATIDIDLSPLVPQEQNAAHGIDKLAERGFAVGTIRYRDNAGDEAKTGLLIYIKTTLPADLPEDIYGYKRQNRSFPDETTMDQVFDEQQFEAYRELGLQLGKRMTASMEAPDNSVMPEQPDLLEKLRRRLEAVRGTCA